MNKKTILISLGVVAAAYVAYRVFNKPSLQIVSVNSTTRQIQYKDSCGSSGTYYVGSGGLGFTCGRYRIQISESPTTGGKTVVRFTLTDMNMNIVQELANPVTI
jgi:hypothetical protein